MGWNGGVAQAASGGGANARVAPRVLIIGAGFGGLAAAKALAKESVEVTVCDRLNYHLFQPLLYQVALAGLAATDVAVPIRSILNSRNTRVLLGDVVDIDIRARRVRLADGGVLDYDYLIVAAGARTNYYGHNEWAQTAPGLKTLEDALEMRRRVLLALEAAERAADAEARRRLLTFVVVGGGPTGVELAGALADLSRDILARDFRAIQPDDVRVILLEASPRILTPFEPRLAERAVEQLRELHVEIRTSARITGLDTHGVSLGDERIASATVLWGAGVAPNELGRKLGAPLDRGGRVIVGPDCAIPDHPEVFVIGDMASFTPRDSPQPLPGISPVAIQEGVSVAQNIVRDVEGFPRVPFDYFDKGFMATIGRGRAVARLRGLSLWGPIAWLAWVFVHLWYLVGFRNRISVFISWIWSYVIARYGARVITERADPKPLLDAAAEHDGSPRPERGSASPPARGELRT